MRRRRWPWELHAKHEALLESLLSPSRGIVADPGEELKIPVVVGSPRLFIATISRRACRAGGKREKRAADALV